MVEVKQLIGVMNTDDSNETLDQRHYKMMRNGRFRNGRIENVAGTTLLPNQYLPSSSNQCIGAFYDDLKQRIFSFNYNANGTHGIYQYDISLKTWSRIALVGYNTDGDIFAFTLTTPIYAVKMLYGDTTQGDTLYFNNSQHEPCQINIKFALAGTYGTIKRSYVNVIKAIPILPPAVTYENDATVTVNNLRKKLFKFKSRYVFSDLSKSCWSSESILPLPINPLGTGIDADATKNCKIAIVVPTGEGDITDIEIAACINEGNTWGDFFLIKVINKSTDSLSNNDIVAYRFLNNQAYTPIDVSESQQLYDLVPLNANCLEFLNGNVPIYGRITEGYNKSIVIGTITSTFEAEQTTQPRFMFVVNQSGDSGFGTSGANIHAMVIGTITVGDVFTIYTTNQTITFTAAAATTASIITGLAAAAVVAGFTVVSSDTENLVILKVGEVLQRSLAVPILIAVSDSFVYDRNSRYNDVIVYLDAAGRSIGGLTSTGMSYQTINYTETATVPNIPKIQLSISSRPPLHAYYFHIGRTKNLSKLTKLEWVSFLTFKDSDYAYISIENLNDFIKDNPSAKHLAYDFSPNDRIRFMKVLSGTVNTIYTDKDFEIQSQVFNPTISGIKQTGQFLKIALPTVGGTFNFGTSPFYNYFIELYTPAQSIANGLDLDYEFGERYTIGNPGTVNAYHQGMLQNQTSNLATPATFEFTQGDYYYRRRTISSGNIAKWTIGPQQSTAVGLNTDYYMALDLLSSTINTAEYTVQSTQAFASNGVPVAQNANYAMLKATIGNTPQFDISARVVFTSTINRTQVNLYVEFTDGAGAHTYLELGRISNVQANIEYTLLIPQVPFNPTFTFPAARNRMYFSLTSNGRTALFLGAIKDGEISLNESARIYTVGIIDPNFSDYFESAVNSNGRAWIVDPNAAQVSNSALLRWGLAYQPNTNINQANRFRPLNFDEVDRGKGDIQQMKVRDRILRIFQNRACGQLGIYAKFLQDSGNTNIVSTTDEIITRNNVQYYAGKFGVGTMPTSLVSGKNQDYFVDPVRGYHLRLSDDGITPISELYKGQFYIQPLFIPYNQNFARSNGGYSKILGCYNYAEEECIVVLQGGTLSGVTIPNDAFSFNEKRNAYCTFFDILNPDWILSGQDVVYAFKNGEMYSFDNTTSGNYTSFFGTKYYPSITLVFNDKQAIKKKYMALSYNSNQLWTAETEGDIKTSFFDPNTGLQQISKLKDFNFSVEEGQTFAAFMRDINSRQDKQAAWHNGGYLGGNWVEIKLTYVGNDFSYLYLPEVKSIVSNINLVTS